MTRRVWVTVSGLAAATVLCVACSMPTTRFTRTGEKYPRRKHLPSEIAVYMSPATPERPHRIVGTFFVRDICADDVQQAQLQELRKRAAREGIDGVMNVEFTTSQGKIVKVGCGCGTPIYDNKESWTRHEARADAFVWED